MLSILIPGLILVALMVYASTRHHPVNRHPVYSRFQPEGVEVLDDAQFPLLTSS